MKDPEEAMPGDYVRWTVFAGQRLLTAPVWAIVKAPCATPGYTRVRIVALGSLEYNYPPREFDTNLHGWGEYVVCEIFSEDQMPDEAWAQIAMEQLTK